MANQFANLPAPADNSAGAGVDVSSFGAGKTIVVAGSWPTGQTPIVTIEFNNDAAQAGSWTALWSTQGGGQTTLEVACKWMRARTANYTIGQAPEVDIGGTTDGTTLVSLPATATDGTGTEIDTSGLGAVKTIQIGGAFGGAVAVEISENGADWGQVASVTQPGFKNLVTTAKKMRARRTGVPNVNPGLPVINVGAADPISGGGGGLTFVSHDGTLAGLGTAGTPLGVVPAALADEVPVLADGTTITGTGVTGDALAVRPAGVAGQVPIATSGAELAGNGTTGSPLHVVPAALDGEVAVAVDGTLSGDGTTGSPLHVLGASQLTPIVSWAATFTAQTSKVNQYNGAAAITANLPAANSVSNGTWCVVKCSKSVGARIQVAPNGADTIAGEPVIMAGGAITLISDGVSSWQVTGYGFQIYGFVSVRTEGAVGDGITNDTTACQAAIDAAGALGGKVFFPPGTYLVDKSGSNSYALTANGHSNLTLEGIKGASWIKLANRGVSTAVVVTLLCNGVNNLTIRDLGIDGNWGNAATTVTAASAFQNINALTGGVLNVVSTAGFPAAATITVVTSTGPQQMTYTGVTATSFTGCTSAGTGYVSTGNNVGYVDANTGINQGTQGDPQSHALMIRGCNNVLVDNCLIQQAYGDGVWIGALSTDIVNGWAFDIMIRNTSVNMCARNCVSMAQPAKFTTIRDSYFNNGWQNIIDCEPTGDNQWVRDVLIDNNWIGGWWNQGNVARNANYSLAMSGGETYAAGGNGQSQSNAVRKFRVINNTILGSVALQTAYDIVIQNNRIIIAWIGNSSGGINAFAWMNHVLIENNEIYVSSGNQSGVPGAGCITLVYYAAGAVNTQPYGAQVVKNRLSCHNGAIGVIVDGVGGHDVGGVILNGIAGTTSNVVGFVATDATKAWAANQWEGFFVRVGTATGTIVTNDATTFTVDNWCDPFGNPVPTPAAVSNYEILSGGGMVDVDNNVIDCSNDGNGQGGYGIEYTAARAGGRCRIRGNDIKNANVSAIYVDSQFRQSVYVEITDNHAWDNQVAPTCINNVQFNYPQNIAKLILRGNTAGDGVTNNQAGINGVSWLQPVGISYYYMHDGYPEELAGFVSPEGNVPAHIGATYHLQTGGLRSLWSKQFDDGMNTGWNPLAIPSTPAWTVDKTSGIGIPQDATEWTAVINAAGLGGIVRIPDSAYGCQDAAAGAKLADMMALHDLAAYGAGTAYQQTIPGWSSLGATTSDNVDGGWQNTDASLPDLSVGDIAMWCYAYQAGTANAVRAIETLGTGASPTNTAYVGGAAATRGYIGGNVQTAAGSQYGIVRPYGIVVNHTLGQGRAFDDANKLTPAIPGTLAGKRIAFGGLSGVLAPGPVAHVYGFAWYGSVGALPTDAQYKKILQTLGWDIIWT